MLATDTKNPEPMETLVVSHEDVASNQLGGQEELAVNHAGAVQGWVRQLHEQDGLKLKGKSSFEFVGMVRPT